MSADAKSAGLEPGVMVDHFRVLRPLGRGATGAVYVAHDTKLSREVALKVIAPDAIGPGLRDVFIREATITASFNHPHIVTIYAVGEHAGSPYLALEYLEGQTLMDQVAVARPTHNEVMRIGQAIAEALAEAHAHAVLHRDLKLENIYLAHDGRLRVLDFGVARRLKPAHVPSSTIPESLAGTPTYVAPELWVGEPASTASDMWSFGVLLFELLEGCTPFEGSDTYALAQSVIEDAPPALSPEVPQSLAVLVLQCLDKDPSCRPSASDAASRLRAPAQVTTITSDAREPSGAARVPTLTILHHADPTRIGQRATLRALLRGKAVKLSRISPRFLGPHGAEPLNDARLSRRPSFVEPFGAGVRLVVNDAANVIRVNGSELSSDLEISEDELEHGVVIEIGDCTALFASFATDVDRPVEADDFGLVGTSDAAVALRYRVRRLAPLAASVLVVGERGTEREDVARAIHRASPRAAMPFVRIEPRAGPTGASLADAAGGTLFVEHDDGTAELERTIFVPLRELNIDARIVIATSSDNEGALLQRLDGYALTVPSLRERREDVALLFSRFMQLELDALEKSECLAPLTSEWIPCWLVAAIARYTWPGNTDEIRRAARAIALDSADAPVILRSKRVEMLLGLNQ